MNGIRKIAFIGFSLVSVATILLGVRYALSTEIMSYHQDAIGMSWQEMTDGVRIMSLNFMKSAGFGFLSVGIALAFLLIVPYRKGERWADFAIIAILASQLGGVGYRTFDVATNTAGNPPLLPLLILVGIAVVSFVLGIAGNRAVK